MPDLDTVSLAAVLVVLLLGTLLWARRRASGGSSRKASAESLDTVEAWPPQAVRVMTLQERQTYELLRRSLPRRMVLAQVPLSRFISVPTEHSYGEWLHRVGRLCADFIVCDSSSRVIAAVDVRAEGASNRSSERHVRIAQVLERAGIPVHVWTAGALPTITEVRVMFRASESEKEGHAPSGMGGLNDLGMMPLPEIYEILEEGDRLATGPVADPVSSGFFDDLEAVEQRPALRA